MSDPATCDKIDCLDGKFWFWETLEEATRPHLNTLDQEGIESVTYAFGINFKGSDEMNDLISEKMMQYHN